jgi:hypothetical protein
MIKHNYTFGAPVRQKDAMGIGTQGEFPVLLDTPTATFMQVTDGFERQYPPCDVCYWQPRASITIGGIETFNCGDRLFEAERSIDDEGHDRMVRLAAER